MIILGGGVIKHHIANANLMVSGDEHLVPSVGWHVGLPCKGVCVLGLGPMLSTAMDRQDPCLPGTDVLVGRQ